VQRHGQTRARHRRSASRPRISPTTSIAIVNVGRWQLSALLQHGRYGQGSDTANAQTLPSAQHSGRVGQGRDPDTDVTPYDIDARLRSFYHMGNAVRLAAEDARRQAPLHASSGCRKAATSRRRTVPEEIQDAAATSSHRPSYILAMFPPGASGPPGRRPPFWMVGAPVSRSRSIPKPGIVRILKLITSSTRAADQSIVETQISSAAVMQLGFTMQEKMECDAGQVTNASLADYKISSILDIPTTSERAVEAEAGGPPSRQGCREPATLRSRPRSQSVEDAVGVRLTALPALRRGGLSRRCEGAPLESDVKEIETIDRGNTLRLPLPIRTRFTASSHYLMPKSDISDFGWREGGVRGFEPIDGLSPHQPLPTERERAYQTSLPWLQSGNVMNRTIHSL